MFTVYKTTKLTDGSFYIGVHSTNNPNDSYLGSGNVITRAVAKCGPENFKKEILFTYVRDYYAFRKEKELIKEAKKDPLCYNIADGGDGGWPVSKEILSRNGRRLCEELHKNPPPALIISRKNWNINPTPAMIEARKKNGIMNITKANVAPTSKMIEARKRNGRSIMKKLQNGLVVCDKCGVVCANVGVLGRHKKYRHKYNKI